MHQVILEFVDGIGVITLNNPRQKNAITRVMAREVLEACDAIDASGCGAAVVRGAGGFFSSGAERSVLQTIAQDPAESERYATLTEIYDCFMRVGRLHVPVVAALRGGAVGAGLNLALAADVRVVSTDAVISSGFRDLGIHQGGGHAYLLETLGGAELAVMMGLLGESISGDEAVRRGLAWVAVPDAGVEQHAMAVASRAAADPELSRAMVDSYRRYRSEWSIAAQSERGPQMWSLARIGRSTWGPPS